MAFIYIFIGAALVTMSGILLTNLVLFPRLRREPAPSPAPRLSVLIPARNEAHVLRETLALLTAQAYPDLEILVLDDHSTDGTGDIARAAGSHVQVIAGAPLPTGWTGKNWACHQLAEQASGDLLLFTDADVRWEADSLTALAALSQRTSADLLTVWPTQISVTWAERLTVPLMSLVVLAYLPLVGVHYIPLAGFGAANGQCMLWRRAAYQRVGGHDAVRGTVLEDVTLARRVKAAGLRLRMADGAGLVACRMYEDWPSVRDGYAKNILAGYGGALPLILATLFHWLIFLVPLLAIPFAAVPLIPLSLLALGLLLRAISAAFTRQRPADALLMPVSVILMTRIAAQSLYWHMRYGGPLWKGRRLA